MAEEKRYFQTPERNETLAERQQERTQRLNHLRHQLGRFTPEWWVRIGEIFGLGFLFLLNFWLVLPFFGSPDQANVFSAPMIPVLADIISPFVVHVYGVRIWILTLLIFFPLSFYFFAREISGRKLIGFISSLVLSLPISFFLPLRLEMGVLDGDGAHIVSLTIIPLICLMLFRFLRSGNFWTGVMSAFGSTLVALTSPMGFLVLGIFMSVLTFSEMLLSSGRLKFLRFIVVVIITAGFSAFWYNPKFVILTLQSPQGKLIEKTFTNLLPISFFLLPILGVFGFLLFENRAKLQPLFIALFLSFTFGFFSLGAGISHPSPSRFLPGLGASLALLIGVAFVGLFDFLRLSEKINKYLSTQYRKWLSFGLLGILFGSVATLIMLSRLPTSGEAIVLGSAAEQRIGFWEIRERTSQIESLIGYTISILTILAVAILRAKLRQQAVSKE